MNPTDVRWLSSALLEAGAAAGTLHRRRDALLVLTAAIRIPPAVIEQTREIPQGKGMAGLAWSRKTPVSTCDLVRDDSGDVQAGARAVGAGQAIAIPVIDDDRIRAVVGFAFEESGSFSSTRLHALSLLAHQLPNS